MKKLLFIGTLLTLVAGCGEKIYTVDELTANDELRKSVLAKCREKEKNEERDKERSPGCKNAFDAQERIIFKML